MARLEDALRDARAQLDTVNRMLVEGASGYTEKDFTTAYDALVATAKKGVFFATAAADGPVE